MSETAVWQVLLSEVRQQIVPDSGFSCTEGFVAEVGPRPTDEKHTRVSDERSSIQFYSRNRSIMPRFPHLSHSSFT